MRSKEVKNAIEEIKHLKSFGTSGIVPRWATIDILLTHIEKLEKEEDRDYITIYLKGCTDKDGYWRDKIRDKIKELEEEKKRYGFSSIESIICVNKIQSLKEILGE